MNMESSEMMQKIGQQLMDNQKMFFSGGLFLILASFRFGKGLSLTDKFFLYGMTVVAMYAMSCFIAMIGQVLTNS